MRKIRFFHFSQISLKHFLTNLLILHELKSLFFTSSFSFFGDLFDKFQKGLWPKKIFWENYRKLKKKTPRKKTERGLTQKKFSQDTFKLKIQKILFILISSIPFEIILNSDFLYIISLSFFKNFRKDHESFVIFDLLWLFEFGEKLNSKKKTRFSIELIDFFFRKKFLDKVSGKKKKQEISDFEIFSGLWRENFFLDLEKIRVVSNPLKFSGDLKKYHNSFKISQKKIYIKGKFKKKKNILIQKISEKKNKVIGNSFIGSFFENSIKKNSLNKKDLFGFEKSQFFFQRNLETHWVFGEFIFFESIRINKFLAGDLIGLFRNEILCFAEIFMFRITKNIYKNQNFFLLGLRFTKPNFPISLCFAVLENFQKKNQKIKTKRVGAILLACFLKKKKDFPFQNPIFNFFLLLHQPFSSEDIQFLNYLPKKTKHKNRKKEVKPKTCFSGRDFRLNWKTNSKKKKQNDLPKTWLFVLIRKRYLKKKEPFLKEKFTSDSQDYLKDLNLLKEVNINFKLNKINPLSMKFILLSLLEKKKESFVKIFSFFLICSLKNFLKISQEQFEKDLKLERKTDLSFLPEILTFHFFYSLIRKSQKSGILTNFFLTCRSLFGLNSNSKGFKNHQSLISFFEIKFIFHQSRNPCKKSKIPLKKIKNVEKIIETQLTTTVKVFSKPKKFEFKKKCTGINGGDLILFSFLELLNRIILNHLESPDKYSKMLHKEKNFMFVLFQLNGSSYFLKKNYYREKKNTRKNFKKLEILSIMERAFFFKIFNCKKFSKKDFFNNSMKKKGNYILKPSLLSLEAKKFL